MTYQEEKQMQIRRQSSKHAIALAMQSRWREAVEVNKVLVENFPQDADAYNRLGKAYMELGEYIQAEEAYRHAVELDPYNIIAKKNLNRLSYLTKSPEKALEEVKKAEPYYFIEETGKSQVFSLLHPAPPEILARTVAGDAVNLRVDGSTVVVEDRGGTYLGVIEPRYGQRLVQLISGGNRYSAAAVSSSGSNISIIVREIYQDPSQAGLQSFPGRRFEDGSTNAIDKVFRDSSEYGEAWSEGVESTDNPEDDGEERAGHDE
jgi:tetratricopeptide (TPR) repeat protein